MYSICRQIWQRISGTNLPYTRRFLHTQEMKLNWRCSSSRGNVISCCLIIIESVKTSLGVTFNTSSWNYINIALILVVHGQINFCNGYIISLNYFRIYVIILCFAWKVQLQLNIGLKCDKSEIIFCKKKIRKFQEKPSSFTYNSYKEFVGLY